jgi:hypothetical protein
MARKYLIAQARIEGANLDTGFFRGAFCGTWFGYIKSLDLAEDTPTKNCKKALICYVLAYIISAYAVEMILRWLPVPRALTSLIVICSALFIVGYTCKIMLRLQLRMEMKAPSTAKNTQ